ncbi:MAG: hypothetical protein JNK49_11685, partial [Planctomycetes bacterium]|nr:hypothetical protein [Planctomycetota bacterium]
PDLAGHVGTANLLDARTVVNLAMFEVRALRHRGDLRSAVRLSLDAAAFARDLHRRGTLIDQMIGAACVAIATHEHWPEPALAQLGPAELADLDRGLERLDHDLPLVADQDGDLAFCLAVLDTDPQDADWLPGRTAAWRYGFSTRWMLADGILCKASLDRELACASELAWPQRKELLERRCGEVAASGNPVLAMMVPNAAAAEQSLRESVALVRLLRLSVARHRQGELPALRDPLGLGPFVVTTLDDGRTRLSSVADEQRERLVRVLGT